MPCALDISACVGGEVVDELASATDAVPGEGERAVARHVAAATAVLRIHEVGKRRAQCGGQEEGHRARAHGETSGSTLASRRPYREPRRAQRCRRAQVEGRPLQESELVERARKGDQGAYGELVQAYQGIAFRTAYLVVGNAADAEDAAQEGFVKASTP